METSRKKEGRYFIGGNYREKLRFTSRLENLPVFKYTLGKDKKFCDFRRFLKYLLSGV
ncbi:unnamed protein product [Meloidogyne enterolobii]|uniref:Uncharacterized protein n=1 Tax=Meloidogyne enterolobii TaxID=390850 RepID=A0ACB0XX07_MELEN